MDAVNRYQQFHGKPPRSTKRVSVHIPSKLVLLGKAIKIEYLCAKRHGGGNGKPAIFYHKFETPVHLFMDERGREALYLLGRRLKVTEAGIEN